MPFDLNRARRDTPGCERVLHFNNAGASLMPTPVLTALQNHLSLEAEIGGYEAHASELNRYEATYHAIARLLNCESSEVALVENATRAWDMAFYGMRFKPGDKVLTHRASYVSNYLAMLHVARRTGVTIEVVPSDDFGQLDVDELERRIDDRVKLIALTHVPTNGGLVNPAIEVGDVAKANGIPYLLDACQSAGQLPLDVQAIGCDFLSATGRKYLRGPRGTGFLYVRTASLSLLEPPFIDLHAATWTSRNEYSLKPDAARFESWEGYVAGKIALGVAVDYALEWGVENTWPRLQRLAADLRSGLSEMPGVAVHDAGRVKGAIVTFSHERVSAGDLKTRLAAQDINVSISPIEYARIDSEERGLPEIIRASVHYYNSDDEIDRFCAAVRSIIGL
ncbi:MAG: aminotransferase class V-fold PLP-dependent enzyme [Bacteroidetes bacterium]|nr:aminotransferase class V-fold PLP-dependent enzyme [Bacteroidota bacterium]